MKKISVLFLSILMVSLVACNAGKYEEDNIILTTVVMENVGTQFQNGDTYDDNTWYRAFEERFHISVRNLWVSNDYTTKLDISITDGELPDVFQVNEVQFSRLQEMGLIMDLTDTFEQYASDTLKGYMAYDNYTFQTAWKDEQLWGIPQLNYGIIDQFQYIWIRKDWKEKIQASDPETMDDVVAIAQEFAEVFGGYPITEDSSLECMKRLAPAWGANPGIWIRLADGTIGYGSVQPEMKEVLEVYAEWYEQGIINLDFPIYDSRKMFQDVVEGKTGVCPMAQWMGYDPMPDVIRKQGENAFFEPYPIPSANSKNVYQNISSGNRGYIVI
ncbi:MAG: extracellular solute-binding protein, partial [Lachnospiraceae bacterium]|nr:extracellular solute-binding protein [Lachnospiraceae bacterium]